MEIIFEIIFSTVVNVLIIYPGAFLRKIILFKNRTFKEVLNEDDHFVNAAVGVFIISVLVIVTIMAINIYSTDTVSVDP